MSYKNSQYKRAESLIKDSSAFYGDVGFGIFKGKSYPFVLKDCKNNLFAEVQNDILTYFEKNKIAWWGGKLTNHALSSQVACLNHLFSIREDKDAVLSMVKHVMPDIIDVLRITSDKYMPAYVQFEAVSDIDYLNEKTSTRGSNCTSIDALIYGVHRDGRKILFPIEWKYVEAYSNENKAAGTPGETRKGRYLSLIAKSNQLKTDNVDIFFFEPFYQLMRQTLWAEQIIAHKSAETFQADDYVHIHVIPTENKDLLNKVYSCSGKQMEETWRSSIRHQDKYLIISPKELLSPIDCAKYHDLLNYLNLRYW